MSNSWPGGTKKPLSQSEHIVYNASHYPGTQQMCCKCDEPTGRCEEDELYIEEVGPLCEECYPLHSAQQPLTAICRISNKSCPHYGGEGKCALPATGECHVKQQ